MEYACTVELPFDPLLQVDQGFNATFDRSVWLLSSRQDCQGRRSIAQLA
jgi:hypothetical protein